MRRIIAVAFMLLVLTLSAGAQQTAIVFCALDKTLDFKMAVEASAWACFCP
jgi:hypothetical protein